LHEIYLPPFATAVGQGHVGAVMCAYGLVNTVFSCQNPLLLTTVLRRQFGFRGLVMSDWGANWSTVASAKAGLDLEMPGGAFFGPALASAVASGAVTTKTLDRMAGDILTSMFRLGVVDHPPPVRTDAAAFADVSSAADQQVALKLAEEGSVLLKNAPGTLPLHLAAGDKIAVIGAPAGFGDIAPYIGGRGSAAVLPTDPVTPLEALTARAAKTGATVVSADGTDPAAAAAVAAGAKVALVFAYDQEAEGRDRTTLALPDNQDQLIEAVAQASPRTVVVLDTGGPVLMPWLDRVSGVLETWYAGQRDGDAVSAILFGDADPSGRLPQTFPASDTSVPASTIAQWPGTGEGQDAAFTERLEVGYRWYDANKVAPLFPFGYGLSYTRFTYEHLHVRRTGASVTVTFTVRNVGTRKGTEIPQLYVDDALAAGEPPKQLQGYQRVFLRPHKSAVVTMTLTRRAFAYWDSSANKWRVAPGLYRILVGSSSRDIRLHGFLRKP
jgi:beta-glucosidase